MQVWQNEHLTSDLCGALLVNTLYILDRTCIPLAVTSLCTLLPSYSPSPGSELDIAKEHQGIAEDNKEAQQVVSGT
jgi:hypothetical protein